MKENQMLAPVKRWKSALRAIGAVAALAAGIQIGAPRAQALEPHLFHELCDPRAPAEDLRQAAHCTTIEALFEQPEGTTTDRLWLMIEGSCTVERKDGSTVTLDRDVSEKNYEFQGEVTLPVTAKWTFPSGCWLLGHLRMPVPVDKDEIVYFQIPGPRIEGDTIRVRVNTTDGKVSSIP